MSRYTRGAIIDSFWKLLKEKKLDKITVRDVIESAQVNRNTFYYHFDDLYALLEIAFREEAIRYLNDTREGENFFDEYIRAVGFFAENKEAIIHVYNSKSREVLNRYMKEAADHFISRFVRIAAKDTGLSEEGILYITNFYSYAITGKTVEWIGKGMPEYRRDLMQTISDSFDATINPMIADYVSHHNQ